MRPLTPYSLTNHNRRLHSGLAATDFQSPLVWPPRQARFNFTSGRKGSIIKWDLHSGARLATFPKLRPGSGKGKEKATIAETPGHYDEAATLAPSDDGKYVASVGKGYARVMPRKSIGSEVSAVIGI